MKNLLRLAEMYKRAAAGIISFDFDDTLYASGDHLLTEESGEDQEGEEFENPGWKDQYVDLMKQYIKDGHTVVVVTSRTPGEAAQAKQMLSEIGINVEVYSAATSDESTKSEVLLGLGVIRHYDDWIEDPGLQAAIDAGIEVMRAESGPPDVPPDI